jgi:hypothetical protein
LEVATIAEACGVAPFAGVSVTVKFTVAYWRKANAVHKWFVDNVQDGIDECNEHSVSKEQLRQLLTICEELIADPSKGPERLPTSDGFFFGSTDYDENFKEDLAETVRQLTPLLNDKRWQYFDFSYRSSW